MFTPLSLLTLSALLTTVFGVPTHYLTERSPPGSKSTSLVSFRSSFAVSARMGHTNPILLFLIHRVNIAPREQRKYSLPLFVNTRAIAALFEWSWPSVQDECSFLAQAGYGYVQVSPAQEHLTGQQWWTAYQCVSLLSPLSSLALLTSFSNITIHQCHRTPLIFSDY